MRVLVVSREDYCDGTIRSEQMSEIAEIQREGSVIVCSRETMCPPSIAV